MTERAMLEWAIPRDVVLVATFRRGALWRRVPPPTFEQLFTTGDVRPEEGGRLAENR